eukprot:scaffold52888_cov70-Phaeocystis_antarctica.AAC.5
MLAVQLVGWVQRRHTALLPSSHSLRKRGVAHSNERASQLLTLTAALGAVDVAVAGVTTSAPTELMLRMRPTRSYAVTRAIHALQRHVSAAVPLAILRRAASLKAQLDARNPGQGIRKTAPAGGERVLSQQTQWRFRLHGGVGALERAERRQYGGLDDAVAQQQRRFAPVACYPPLAASTVEAVDLCPIESGTAAHVQAVDDVASTRRRRIDKEGR